MKCKPTYQYQSVEFDYNVNSPADLPDMFRLYLEVLKGLMQIAPIQDQKGQPKENLATPKQKEIMDRFGIKYSATTTAKEAQELIKKSIES